MVQDLSMRRAGTIWAFGSALLLVFGPTAGAPSATAADLSPVVLISVGQSPRSTLRLALTEGTQARATMQMSQSVTQSMGGQQLAAVESPPTTMRMHATAGPPTAGGNTTVTYGYSDVAVLDDGSLGEELLARYQAALAPIESLAGTAALTPRNPFVDSQIAGLDGLDPAVAQTVSQMSDQLGSFSAPFPREPVGIGARWRVVSQLSVSGVDVRQTALYTLRERDGDRVVLDVVTKQTAPRQVAEFPGMPSGTKVEVASWKVSGTGTTTLSLVQPVLPLSSVMSSSGRQVLDITAAGDRGTLVQKVTVFVEVSP